MMYGSAHLDTQLHDPWPIPDNIGPNHCPVGCSILINAPPPADHGHGISGQLGRGFQAVKRRFSNSAHSGIPGVSTGAIGGPADFGPGYTGQAQVGSLGKGRSSSFGSAGSIGDGGGGGVSPIKEKSGWLGSGNPFSHSYVGSQAGGGNGGNGTGAAGGAGVATKAGAIFDDLNPFAKDKDRDKDKDKAQDSSSGMSTGESNDTLTSSSSNNSATPPPTLGRRGSAIRFGTCPSRPPELRRQSSITLGVAARRGLLMEGNDAAYGAPRINNGAGTGARAGGAGGGVDGSASGSITPPRRNSTGPSPTKAAAKEGDDIEARFKAYQRSAPKEHSETNLHPMKSFWHKVLHPTDSSHAPSPGTGPGALSDPSTGRRASAPVLSTRQNMYKSSSISPVSPTTPTSAFSSGYGSGSASSSSPRGSPTVPSSAGISSSSAGAGGGGYLEAVTEQEGERTPRGSGAGTPRASAPSTPTLGAAPGSGGRSGISTSERLNERLRKEAEKRERAGDSTSPSARAGTGGIGSARASSTSLHSASDEQTDHDPVVAAKTKTAERSNDPVKGVRLSEVYGRPGTPGSLGYEGVVPRGAVAGTGSGMGSGSPASSVRGSVSASASVSGSGSGGSGSAQGSEKGAPPSASTAASAPAPAHTPSGSLAQPQHARKGSYEEWAHPPTHHHSPTGAIPSRTPDTGRHVSMGSEPKPAGHQGQAEGVNATLRHPDAALRAPSPPPPAASQSSSVNSGSDQKKAEKGDGGRDGAVLQRMPSTSTSNTLADRATPALSSSSSTATSAEASAAAGAVNTTASPSTAQPPPPPVRRRASDASRTDAQMQSDRERERVGERSHAVLGFHARLADIGKGFTSGF